MLLLYTVCVVLFEAYMQVSIFGGLIICVNYK